MTRILQVLLMFQCEPTCPMHSEPALQRVGNSGEGVNSDNGMKMGTT